MERNIIKIDEDKCNGCGLCVTACHEGAIDLVNGKAKLMREHYCDGLGDCLPACPVDAISFEMREAPAYDHEAVMNAKKETELLDCGCPGSQIQVLSSSNANHLTSPVNSQLAQWPVQIQLVPVNAPYFQNADLLIAADCCAYAYGDFHNQFMKNKVTLIGCPKLDAVDYTEKLTEIIKQNEIKSLLIVRMEVPCCGGIEHAAKEALKSSGRFIPWQVVTITKHGVLI